MAAAGLVGAPDRLGGDGDVVLQSASDVVAAHHDQSEPVAGDHDAEAAGLEVEQWGRRDAGQGVDGFARNRWTASSEYANPKGLS